ncbi:D-alanyl-D-alanine carboxypeptidase family protein [Streptomyces zaomyceticus]|uniref:D-alanyl-D-alanine carboxypeptidase family protein n=1 Tax=Streptomyces zaomyceticus TaxID=68286 RepID=UPI003713BBB6
MLHESDASSAAPVSSVQVDQPTAVFKTLAPRTPEDDAPTAAKPGSESEADAEAPQGPEAGGEPERAGEPESERLKAAVAAWVATEAEPEGEAAGTSEESEASDESEAPEEPEESEAPVDSDGEAESEPEAGAAAAAAEAADEPQTDEPGAAAEAEGDSGDDSGDDSDDGSDDGSDEAGEADGAASDEEPVEAPVVAKASTESWFAARKSAEAPSQPSQPSQPSDVEDGSDAGSDEDADSDSDSGTDDVDDEPVDQPTTMFKAVRLPVDQPTTALKLPPSLTGSGSGSGTGTASGSAGSAAGDSDSERTSVFLPLRADIPAEQKAERAAAKAQEAPAAPAARTTAPEAGAAKAPKPAASAAAASAPVQPKPNPALAEAERTRQQPLPPLPPLDLLAELTNTPPPPPTPLRTTVRRVRIWTPLVLLLLIVFAIVQMVRPLPPPVLTLSAAPTFSFEGGELKLPFPHEGQGAVEVEGVGSMGTYGAQKPAPIASVTKTMTAYVILRDHPLKGSQKGPEIEIDQKAADQGKAEHESTAAVQKGQTYTERELLELLMIPSANNVARLLARWDAGSEAAFVEKMNAAAKDLGMTQSTYTDPSGLLDSTVSTPQDQLKLAKAVMQYDVFRKIVNMPNVTVDGIPGRIENNNNILLKPGVGGIKTGSSTPAGGNLLWSANTVVDGQNRRILGIVMGAKDAEQLGQKLQLAIDNSYKIIQQAQKDVTSAAVVRKGQVLGYIDDGLGGRTPVVATKELKAIGWPGLQVKLALTDGGKVLPHSGKAGDIVGQVSIGTGAGKVSSPVALQADLVEPGFDKKLTRVG